MARDLSRLTESVLAAQGIADRQSKLLDRIAMLQGAAIGPFAKDWRTELLKGTDLSRIAKSVSGSMSEILAAKGTASVMSFTANFGSAARIADAGGSLGIWAKDLSRTYEFLAKAIQPAALTASLDWMERFKDWEAEDRRLEDELRSYGWSIVPTWTRSDVRDAVRIGRDRGKRALASELCGWYRENRQRGLRRLVDGWMADETFSGRRAILRDGLQDHVRGRYRVSVPTLLPLIEGIAFEVFDPDRSAARRTNPKALFASRVGQEELREVLSDALLHALTLLWGDVDFVTVKPGSRVLNRHLVLHGRTIGYGTEANSLRVFFALDHLHSEIQTWRREVKR